MNDFNERTNQLDSEVFNLLYENDTKLVLSRIVKYFEKREKELREMKDKFQTDKYDLEILNCQSVNCNLGASILSWDYSENGKEEFKEILSRISE